MTLKNLSNKIALFSLLCLVFFPAHAEPETDRVAFSTYFSNKFPSIPFQEFAKGVYAIDPVSRAKWEEIEQFPPYETAIEEGRQLYNAPFKNGQYYARCLPNKGFGISQFYPKYDEEQKQVITLALLINQCRTDNKEKALPYGRGEIAALLAYLTQTSRGKKINVEINHAAANATYEKGKQFYYARRGRLNMACAHCHIDNAGKRIRAEIIGPALGQVSAYPVYRSAWAEMGTLHRRFADCTQRAEALPFEGQSEEYRNLEYFLRYMSNGIQVTGPSSRN